MESEMREVCVSQGLPGSGKSTAAEKMAKQMAALATPASTVICSADDYHMVDGEYVFKFENLGKAHAHCLRRFLSALQTDINLVIVDNTNIMNVEIAPYAALALAYDYNLSIVRYECSVESAIARNKHDVPEEAISRMAAAMETPIARWAELEIRNTDQNLA